MSYKKQVLYETLRTIDSATFNSTFLVVGTPLLHPASIVKIVNNSTSLITVSTDGINAMDVVPAGSFVLYDYTSNTPVGSVDGVFVPRNTQYLVSGVAGTGLVYLVVQYVVEV
jgi:hypothetical protein